MQRPPARQEVVVLWAEKDLAQEVGGGAGGGVAEAGT